MLHGESTPHGSGHQLRLLTRDWLGIVRLNASQPVVMVLLWERGWSIHGGHVPGLQPQVIREVVARVQD